jgi:hypothetical protein
MQKSFSCFSPFQSLKFLAAEKFLTRLAAGAGIKKEPLVSSDSQRDRIHFHWTLDSASHEIHVTVRQVFPGEPAVPGSDSPETLRRISLFPAAAVRPCRRVLMISAPLSQRFNFYSCYHPPGTMSIGHKNKSKSLWNSNNKKEEKTGITYSKMTPWLA